MLRLSAVAKAAVVLTTSPLQHPNDEWMETMYTADVC